MDSIYIGRHVGRILSVQTTTAVRRLCDLGLKWREEYFIWQVEIDGEIVAQHRLGSSPELTEAGWKLFGIRDPS
jgi:hypothetical protein